MEEKQKLERERLERERLEREKQMEKDRLNQLQNDLARSIREVRTANYHIAQVLDFCKDREVDEQVVKELGEPIKILAANIGFEYGREGSIKYTLEQMKDTRERIKKLIAAEGSGKNKE